MNLGSFLKDYNTKMNCKLIIDYFLFAMPSKLREIKIQISSY